MPRLPRVTAREIIAVLEKKGFLLARQSGSHLREGVESFLTGDVETGKTILRDYINATIGFHELAAITNHSPKSLMRMLGPSGNPYARNLFEIVSCLQKKTGVHFQLRASAATAGR